MAGGLMAVRTPGKRPGTRAKATKKTPAKKRAPSKAKPKKKPAQKTATKKSKAKKPKAVRVKPSPRRQNKPYAESEVARLRLPPSSATQESMRFHAGKDYVYDPHQQSARWWHEAHYVAVPWETFRKWVQTDDWTSRRENHWRTVENAIGRRIASDLVLEQVNEVKQLAELRTAAFGMLLPGKDAEDKTVPAPKSFESLVTASLAIDKRLDDKRETVLDQLPLALGSQTAETQIAGPGVSYSEDEMRAMAQARMRVQQQQLESTLAESSEEG
jgi:hypothetical protein